MSGRFFLLIILLASGTVSGIETPSDSSFSETKVTIDSLLVSARQFASEKKVIEADEFYLKAVQADSSHFGNVFEYASFLQKNRLSDKAEIWLKKAMALAGDEHGSKASIYNCLAVIYNNRKDYDKAEQSYLRSLELFRQMAQAEPEKYKPLKAMVLNNLAVLRENTGKDKVAEETYLEELNVLKELCAVKPEEFERKLAALYYNLADLQNRNGKQNEAVANYNNSLTVYRKINGPKDYSEKIALNLNNLGWISFLNKEYDKAASYYNESLELFKALEAKKPGLYTTEIDWTLNNIQILKNALAGIQGGNQK